MSSDLLRQALILIVAGSLGIVGWITYRFRDVKFGVTALVSLLHDVIVVAEDRRLVVLEQLRRRRCRRPAGVDLDRGRALGRIVVHVVDRAAEGAELAVVLARDLGADEIDAGAFLVEGERLGAGRRGCGHGGRTGRLRRLNGGFDGCRARGGLTDRRFGFVLGGIGVARSAREHERTDEE